MPLVNIILEIIFALGVAADTIITYKIIGSGKGVEIGPIAKYYIDNKFVAITLSIICTVVLIGLWEFTGFWWIAILADIYMGRRVWKNWRIWRDR